MAGAHWICCCDGDGGPRACPGDSCIDCPQTLLVTITDVVLLRDDFTTFRFNHVEMIMSKQGSECIWNVASVLVNEVDQFNLPGPDCEFAQPLNPSYSPSTAIFCDPEDPVLANWRFRLEVLGGVPLGVGCFFSPAINNCPMGIYLPCVPDEEGCDSGPGFVCGRQDWCGPPAGRVVIE